MRRVAAVLCAVLLLSGCTMPAATPKETESAVLQTEPAMPAETTQPTVPEYPEPVVPVLDQAQLGIIDIPFQSKMTEPQIHILKDRILLHQILEESTGFSLYLMLVSMHGSTVLAETTVPCTGFTEVQAGEDRIAVFDSTTGNVEILNNQLQTEKIFSFTADHEKWWLDRELTRLYSVRPDSGVLIRRLSVAAEGWLVSQALQVSVLSQNSEEVILHYLSRQDQMYHTVQYSIADDTLTPVMPNQETGVLPGGYILHQQEQTLTLYDADGSFVSRCCLQENWQCARNFSRGQLQEGWFFTLYTEDDARLAFWDLRVSVEGEDLESTEEKPPEQLAEPELYQRAEEISGRYGVDVRLAEQCRLDYGSYYGKILTDSNRISQGLDILETALQQYPEGFFRQLCYGDVRRIRIELVDILDAVENSGKLNPKAFAQENEDHYLLVFEVNGMSRYGVFHELSHVIDRRLAWDKKLRQEALYSESQWLQLQPEGFAYTYSTQKLPNITVDSQFFLGKYACLNPTEDRAALMGKAMDGQIPDLKSRTGLAAKLQYYSDCIRDCFDTTGWPEVTAWEKPLFTE